MDIAFVPDDPEEQIPYDEAVERGRNLVLVMKDSLFELGRITDRLEPKYGDSTLQRFAEEIGIDYGTLKSYRTTHKAWKDKSVRPKSFSVAKALNPHPRKAEIIQEKPDISVNDAVKEVETWKQERRAEKKKSATHAPRSEHAIHMTTGRIISTLNDFLSAESTLTAMILELVDELDADSSNISDIVEALGNVPLRAHTIIESIWNTIRSNAAVTEPENEAEEETV
jgi:hypothetical protein